MGSRLQVVMAALALICVVPMASVTAQRFKPPQQVIDPPPPPPKVLGPSPLPSSATNGEPSTMEACVLLSLLGGLAAFVFVRKRAVDPEVPHWTPEHPQLAAQCDKLLQGSAAEQTLEDLKPVAEAVAHELARAPPPEVAALLENYAQQLRERRADILTRVCQDVADHEPGEPRLHLIDKFLEDLTAAEFAQPQFAALRDMQQQDRELINERRSVQLRLQGATSEAVVEAIMHDAEARGRLHLVDFEVTAERRRQLAMDSLPALPPLDDAFVQQSLNARDPSASDGPGDIVVRASAAKATRPTAAATPTATIPGMPDVQQVACQLVEAANGSMSMDMAVGHAAHVISDFMVAHVQIVEVKATKTKINK